MGKKITTEILDTIEDCGAAEMPLEETVEIAEISMTDYMSSEDCRRRYKRGQLKTKLAIRRAVVKGAQSGNPQMLKEYQNFTATTSAEASELLKDIVAE